MTSQSQAGQDIFVRSILKNKRNGVFLEIGSNHPIVINNTYVLESQFDWTGIMVEYDKSFANSYKTCRPRSTHFILDATKVDYQAALCNMPNNIDYLQIDLDVDNSSTLTTLNILDDTIFDNYKFATVTFEHDIYRGDFFETRKISREIFKKRGYELVFPDVKVFVENSFKPFEDWYVHPDLVDMQYVNTIKSDVSMSCNDIVKRLGK